MRRLAHVKHLEQNLACTKHSLNVCFCLQLLNHFHMMDYHMSGPFAKEIWFYQQLIPSIIPSLIHSIQKIFIKDPLLFLTSPNTNFRVKHLRGGTP